MPSTRKKRTGLEEFRGWLNDACHDADYDGSESQQADARAHDLGFALIRFYREIVAIATDAGKYRRGGHWGDVAELLSDVDIRKLEE